MCLRGNTDSGHRPAVEGPRAKSGSRDSARFTFFLASANFFCRTSSDISGRGGVQGGHITAIPETTSELLPAATTHLCG